MGKNITSAYEQATKYLNMKMYSTAALADKLLQKGFDPEEVDEAIAQLKEDRFLNDELYGETFVQNLLSYRTFGFYGIRQKLLMKKIDKELVDKLLAQYVDIEAETEVAKRFVEKNKNKSKESLIQAMRRRGFRTEIIIEVLKYL